MSETPKKIYKVRVTTTIQCYHFVTVEAESNEQAAKLAEEKEGVVEVLHNNEIDILNSEVTDLEIDASYDSLEEYKEFEDINDVFPLILKKASHNQFLQDMRRAGLDVYIYRGRFSYEGPAVNCDSIDEVISKTSAKCQWDNMGLGFVVYPR